MSDLYSTEEKEERLILVLAATGDEQTAVSSLDELEELLYTAGGRSVGRLIQNREKPHNATYLGKGKLEELKELIAELGADGIVTDDELSPAQLRNMESILDTKVIDRTMLILDIFAKRAGSSEGKIQVELAQLKYAAARLVGLRSSLSRLGGGIGTRGPGEKKLEMDRRVIHDRISLLKEQLREVQRHREQTRKARENAGSFIISIVGYTNAGKSTLLNTLTEAKVLAEDKLFATLDPTTRKLVLESGQEVLLTDTVGFIRKLPHHLIDAFQSTLEEAKYADLILHVVDLSNPDADAHMLVVYETLKKLSAMDKDIITVYNKVDICSDQICLPRDFHALDSMKISAKSGRGLAELKEMIERIIRSRKIYLEKVFSYQNAGRIQDIRKYGELISEEYTEQGIAVKAYVPCELYGKLQEYGKEE
ncbi:GTPase HflX [Bacteroides heparinolyticus]|uniref:GTPase HflX n=1 Tax=Prevotella heparinolytica TaxID=28113 RepID=UPI0035A13459